MSAERGKSVIMPFIEKSTRKIKLIEFLKRELDSGVSQSESVYMYLKLILVLTWNNHKWNL